MVKMLCTRQVLRLERRGECKIQINERLSDNVASLSRSCLLRFSHGSAVYLFAPSLQPVHTTIKFHEISVPVDHAVVLCRLLSFDCCNLSVVAVGGSSGLL